MLNAQTGYSMYVTIGLLENAALYSHQQSAEKKKKKRAQKLRRSMNRHASSIVQMVSATREHRDGHGFHRTWSGSAVVHDKARTTADRSRRRTGATRLKAPGNNDGSVAIVPEQGRVALYALHCDSLIATADRNRAPREGNSVANDLRPAHDKIRSA